MRTAGVEGAKDNIEKARPLAAQGMRANRARPAHAVVEIFHSL
jgi:hypothetical protein